MQGALHKVHIMMHEKRHTESRFYPIRSIFTLRLTPVVWRQSHCSCSAGKGLSWWAHELNNYK